MTRSHTPELAAVRVEGMTRSAFLVRTALATGGVLGAGAVTPAVRRALAQGGRGGDVEIVKFALTLEQLEAAFYERGLAEVSGLSADARKLVEELRDNENEHVERLRATLRDLGGKPASAPRFDFARAHASAAGFLRTAHTLEETGVGAYNGAVPELRSREILAVAGAIVQVEARHAALVRLQDDASAAPQAFDQPLRTDAALAAVKPFMRR